MYLASRVAWVLAFGSDPGPDCVLHRCDNSSCNNPAHLFLGDIVANKRDMWGKGRGRIPHQRGERNNKAKLTSEAVVEIRRRYVPGTHTSEDLAVEFGVTRTHIQRIAKGKFWRHLGGEPCAAS